MTEDARVERGTTPADRKVREEISSLAEKGRISCRAAFSLAEQTGLSVPEVGRAIDGMGIKIVGCQLGCFK